jgi:hypothetical protein
VLSFCCWELSGENKAILLLCKICHLNNKVHLCIARSCHVIISASFCYLGLSRENKLPHFKDNNFFVVVQGSQLRANIVGLLQTRSETKSKVDSGIGLRSTLGRGCQWSLEWT